jgi:RNA-binding protein with serine-rich domain 1
MSTKERSASPQSRDVDVDMDKPPEDKLDAKVVVITNLTRNVVEAHLQSIFGFYGEIAKIDLPIYVKCAYYHMPPFPFPLSPFTSNSGSVSLF